MVEVEVVNMRLCKDWGKPGDVKIDRTTRWGNPFVMQNWSKEERNRVCDEYEKWFEQQEKEGKLYLHDLVVDGAKRLGCHCDPQRCHGHYLQKRLREIKS